jgi:PAS domain S-box-containing protein
MPSRRVSLATIVAATLVTVTTLLLGPYSIISYRVDAKEQWKALHGLVSVQANELAVALALPIWNFDDAQLDKVIEAMAQPKSIYGLSVSAAGRVHGRVRNSAWKLVPWDGRFEPAGMLVEERTITFSGEKLGTVRLLVTPRFTERDLRVALLRHIAPIVAINLLLIVFTYFILWRTVLRPLVKIGRYAVAVRDGQVVTMTAGSGFPAELESLRSSIESMVHLLDRRYAELREEMARRLESEERFRTIFDSVNDAIVIDDGETGAIVDVNARMTEMFGYTHDEALQQDVVSLSSNVEPYTPREAEEHLNAARERGAQVFEWHSRHKDGHLFWTEVSTRMATLDGKPRVVVVVRDIDQRKEMEAALRRSETMSAMGALVGGVAHEVRNPLFGMTALLDAYAEEMSDPDLAELANGLRQQVTRLTALTSELLEFGRPVKITPTPGQVGKLIDEVIATRARAADAAGVTLRSLVPTSLPAVPMDHSRLRQVFDNLIDNAMQHSPSVRTVTVNAREVVQNGRLWVECTVEDDGSGFNPADLPRVFEPFFTRRERGIGLGMSIVQRIVEEHGGRVTAGNREVGGAIVTVRLPAVSSS